MVESRRLFRSWVSSSAGMAHHGVANLLDAVPVSTRAPLAGLMLAGLRVVCLRSGRGCSCGLVGARLSWLPHGRLGLREVRRAAAGGCIAECCLCTVLLLQEEYDYKNMQATKNPKILRICAA